MMMVMTKEKFVEELVGNGFLVVRETDLYTVYRFNGVDCVVSKNTDRAINFQVMHRGETVYISDVMPYGDMTREWLSGIIESIKSFTKYFVKHSCDIS